MSLSYSSIVTKNLRDYIIGTTEISDWEIHKINNFTIVINGNSQSLFNYVFHIAEEGEYCIESAQKVLSYLQERKIDATWPGNSSCIASKLESLGIRCVSTPKKAFLNVKNYLLPQSTVPSLVLDIVDNEKALIELDKTTSTIFYHDIGIVKTFLRGLPDHDHKTSKLKFFLAKLNGLTVGTCGIYIQDGIAGLYSDGILPMYRNQGIATQMVIERIKIAQQYECEYIIAHCTKFSVNLYKRMGFKILGNLYLHVSSA